MQKTRRIEISVPSRIRERWRKTHDNSGEFTITKALSEAKVSPKEFRTCWKRVQPTIPEEDLLRLLKKAFGSGHNLRGKVDFIKDILRRYQEAHLIGWPYMRIWDTHICDHMPTSMYYHMPESYMCNHIWFQLYDHIREQYMIVSSKP